MSGKDVLIGLVAVVLIVLAVAGLFVWGSYNSLMAKDVNVEKAVGNMQTMYQRRADLIPNLVATVEGSAMFEKGTQTDIAKFRTGLDSAQTEAEALKAQAARAQTPADFNAVGQGIEDALQRFSVTVRVVVEAYPDLKSTQNFMDLQSQLEGTENRIAYARTDYNNAVQDYKLSVRQFPSNIIAGMYGFNVDKWSMFQAAPGSEKAPVVKFNF